MTREQIIAGLEEAVDFSAVEQSMTIVEQGIVRGALELLKAQEPIEPKYVEFEDRGVTWEKYEVATCGTCGALLGDALYCPMCGRAVKWE